MSCVDLHPIIHTPDAEGQLAWRRWIEIAPAVTTSGGGGGGRVLLISYTFPPVGGSGVQRPAKLAKYLPEFGWNVEVLAAGHERFPWHDATLIDDIPPDCRVHRVPGYEPACLARRATGLLQRIHRRLARFMGGRDQESFAEKTSSWIEDRIYWRLVRWAERLGLGDGESLWIGPATREALRRHRQCPFDIIVSTGPPAFVHRVALGVARASGLPWVADVRDPFVSDHGQHQQDDWKTQTMAALERTVLENATAVVTTCESLAADYRRRYPQAVVRAITNGFDRDDILAAIAQTDSPIPDKETCTLTAAGAFYGQRELSRLVHALQQVLLRHPEWCQRVRLVVAGSLDAQQYRRLNAEKPEWMTFAGYLDHTAVINLIRRSACAVLIAPACNHTRLCLPGKMFELMALPTHLLALVPRDSETERLLMAAGACTAAPYEREDLTTSALERVIADHFAGRLSSLRDWSNLTTFDRREIAAAWADCLNTTSAHSAHEMCVPQCNKSIAGLRRPTVFMLLVCWAGFLVFLVASHSFRRFCTELLRLVERVL